MEAAGLDCHNPDARRRPGRPRGALDGNAELKPSRPLRQPDSYREGQVPQRRRLLAPGLAVARGAVQPRGQVWY